MLHYRAVGEGRPLIIVHGLFGSGDNWATIAGKFPGYRVFLPDLPNHGGSPWLEGFSHADLASSLAAFHEELHLEPCPWIGHSLGGKAVMELALTQPNLCRGVAVLDITPQASPARYPEILSALRGLDLNTVTSRSDAQERLAPSIPGATLLFLLKSLVPGDAPGTWKWKLNLEGLERNYAEIWKALAPGRTWDGPALFLYGEASDYVQPGDEGFCQTFFPEARLEGIPGAGHWLHADKPAEVVSALTRWLDSLG